MDVIYYLIPLVFAAFGYVTNFREMYAFGGVMAFYGSYTLINEATTLTNSIMMLSIIYVMLAISLLLRVAIPLGGEKK